MQHCLCYIIVCCIILIKFLHKINVCYSVLNILSMFRNEGVFFAPSGQLGK